jgi:hypothetical protein
MSIEFRQRLRKVPAWVGALLACALVLQIALAATRPDPVARAAALPPGPAAATLAWLQTFDRLPAAHFLDLYLQAFDNQPGISIPYLDLDYTRVVQWLRASLRLDPESQYPLLMAAQLYAQVPDPQRQRYMLDFVYEQYLLDPERRWRWLAHGVIMAKHRLKDLALALKYARVIAEHSPRAPSWARQMHIFILEDMGEYEAAKILLGGLLATGVVTDRHEQILLQESLERIEAAEKSTGPTIPRRAGESQP